MLLLDLLSTILGLVGSDEVRHVADTGHDEYDGTDPAEPLRRIADAIAVRSTLDPGKRLVIQLHGSAPFKESLDLPSGVVIVGPGTIEAPSPGPAVRIAGTAGARRAGIELRQVELVGGRPHTGLGGAVVVQQADDVRLEGCVLRDSRAGRGGGIAITDATAVVLERCTVRGNRAETSVPDVDIDVAPPSVDFTAADGHGGGIFVRDAEVKVVDCTVDGNFALFAGGGIGVSHVTQPTAAVEIAGCEITRNQVSHGPLAALGPTWTTIALPVAANDDPIREKFRFTVASEEDELKALANAHGMNYESGLGGGIALRNTQQNTIVRGCTIGRTRAGVAAPNIARRGGGIHCYVGAFPTVADCVIANNAASGDGGGIGADYFDPFVPGGVARLGVQPVAMVTRRPLQLDRNRFEGNQSIEDGGGLYVTGLALPRITGGAFVENRAGEHAGAIRATYASELIATGVHFERNRANVIQTEATGDVEGGGAVSARNSDVHLEDCDFVNNRVIGFAGGAVYYRSSFEGGVGVFGLIPDEHGMFDEIQETEFGYRTRRLRIVDCRADDNRAMGARGAGGFLYALRSPDTVGAKIHGGQEPMWVSIEGAGTAIKTCTSEFDRGGTIGTRKRGTIVVELSGLHAGAFEDRLSIGREIPAPAIAASVPSPDGRALVLMPAAAASSDVRQATFAGGHFVFGPTPTLTALDASIVPAAGGTRVRATGSGFETGMRVHVGALAATVASETATRIDFDVPAGPAAATPVDVVVSLPSGAQAWLAGALKLVLPPQITYMSTLRGRAGDSVVVRGKGMPVGTTIDFMFDSTAVPATITAQAADDELTVTVPARPGGGGTKARVRATSPTGEQFTRPAEKAFTYLA
jgi:predicted outer membrane repeat protein